MTPSRHPVQFLRLIGFVASEKGRVDRRGTLLATHDPPRMMKTVDGGGTSTAWTCRRLRRSLSIAISWTPSMVGWSGSLTNPRLRRETSSSRGRA